MRLIKNIVFMDQQRLPATRYRREFNLQYKNSPMSSQRNMADEIKHSIIEFDANFYTTILGIFVHESIGV